jgi:hypothetical protein
MTESTPRSEQRPAAFARQGPGGLDRVRCSHRSRSVGIKEMNDD